MFVLRDRYEFTAPVTVRVPNGDGEHVEQAFTGRFTVLSTDQIKALSKGRTGDQADATIIREALIGWTDMVDETNAPVPFSEAMRDRLLGVPFVLAGLAATYIRAIGGAGA